MGREKKVVPVVQTDKKGVPGPDARRFTERRPAMDLHVLEPEHSSAPSSTEEATAPSSAEAPHPAADPDPPPAATTAVPPARPAKLPPLQGQKKLPPLPKEHKKRHSSKKASTSSSALTAVQSSLTPRSSAEATSLEDSCAFIEALIGCADCVEHAFAKIDFDKDQLLGKNDLKRALAMLEIDMSSSARRVLRDEMDITGNKRIVLDDLRDFIERTACELQERATSSRNQKRKERRRLINLAAQFMHYLHGTEADSSAPAEKAKRVSRYALRRFLKKHEPAQLPNVDELLSVYTGDEIVENALSTYGVAPKFTLTKKAGPKTHFQLVGLSEQRSREGVYELQKGVHDGRIFYKCVSPPNYMFYCEQQKRWLVGPTLGGTTAFALYNRDPEAMLPEEITEKWRAYDGPTQQWLLQPAAEMRWPGQREFDPKKAAPFRDKVPPNWAVPPMNRRFALWSCCGTTCPIVAFAAICIIGMIYTIAACASEHGCASVVGVVDMR